MADYKESNEVLKEIQFEIPPNGQSLSEDNGVYKVKDILQKINTTY